MKLTFSHWLDTLSMFMYILWILKLNSLFSSYACNFFMLLDMNLILPEFLEMGLKVAWSRYDWLLKNAQHKSGKLSFIWGKIRTIVQERAFKIALRNCWGGGSVYRWFWWKRNPCNQAHIFCRFLANLMKVTSQEEQSSPLKAFQCFSRYEEILELG